MAADDMPLQLMVLHLRREMSAVSKGKTYHACVCGRSHCSALKCWKCWKTDMVKAVGKTQAAWLGSKIRESLAIEADIHNFILSQTEGDK